MSPPSVKRQVAEIATEPDRAAVYARLLDLQRGCADDPSTAADLAAELSSSLLPLLLSDAAAGDEAIAISALKCLGFAIYHPVLVSTISAQMALSVLDTLVQLVLNTQMKSACNLGVWCIAVQQLEPFIIDDRADAVFMAIVHALDNPFGSLSTTFEATQAIMNLAGQCPKRMRELSSLWVPSIYRRLLSADKTERDISERCLIKVSGIILPPQPLLSKAVASDLQDKLLSSMLNMLDDHSKKIQAVKSWGWIISLLGLEATKNRPLLNKLLKVPEQLFIDQNPQVQVATMVSWRNLVDAFFPSQVNVTVAQPNEQASAQVKRIRLIMVPLCRVLSRSRNIVLSTSCLSTWNYLLHRIGNLINQLPILEASFGPVLKIIFSFGVNEQNKQLWSFCMNLFRDFVSSKNMHREDLCPPVHQNLLGQSCIHIKTILNVQHIKWLPWDISCFHFLLDILGTILNPEIFQDMISEMIVIVVESATEIFRFLVQGLQMESRDKHAYEQVNRCITDGCKFVKKLWLNHVGKDSFIKCPTLLEFCLQFAKVIMEELDHSLLTSENIEVCLDIEHIKESQHAECSTKVSLPRIRSLSYMEMVPPAVYVTVLSLSMIAQYAGELSHRDAEKLALIVSSSDMESFHAAVSFMYMQMRHPTYNRQRFVWLIVWNTFAKHLNMQIISNLETSSGSSYHNVLHQFFCYPFLFFIYPMRMPIVWNAENSSEPGAPVLQDLEIESTIEVYRSFSTDLCHSNFASKVFCEGLYEHLVYTIDENMILLRANLAHSSNKFANAAILSALGEVVIGLLQNDQMLAHANQQMEETREDSSLCRQSKLFLSCFELANRFLRLSSFSFKANPAGHHQVISRFFSSLSYFVGRLVLKKDIQLLFEIIGDQLTEWLSLTAMLYSKMQQGETTDHLEKLWLKVAECLKRSQLISDGSLCQKQQLLQVALSHPHNPISVAITSVCREATHVNTIQHPGCSNLEFDELLMHRKGINSFGERTITTHSTTELITERDGPVTVPVGLQKKRLKLTKYSTKPKGFNKSAAHSGFYPRFMENKVYRKPELILEMLKRKK